MNAEQPRFIESRAEVLYCLDVLVRHLADESVMDTWLALGVPDGTLEKWPTDEQVSPFIDYAEDISDFEEIVRTGITLIHNEAIRTKSLYVKGAFA